MVVPRSTSLVITPPTVSIPRERGATSRRTMSLVASAAAPAREGGKEGGKREGGKREGGREGGTDGRTDEQSIQTTYERREGGLKRGREGEKEGAREGKREALLTRKNGPLHGSAIGDCFVGIDALVKLLAVEEIGEELLDLRKGGREGGREGGRTETVA